MATCSNHLTRRICAEFNLDFKPDDPDASSVLLIGGVIENGDLFQNDKRFFENGLNMMRKKTVAPKALRNIQIANVNPRYDYGGEDFLDIGQNWQADIIYSCFISSRSDKKGGNAVLGSPYHRLLGMWVKAAEYCGAKIIVTAGREMREIDAAWFTGMTLSHGMSPYRETERMIADNVRKDGTKIPQSLLVHEAFNPARTLA